MNKVDKAYEKLVESINEWMNAGEPSDSKWYVDYGQTQMAQHEADADEVARIALDGELLGILRFYHGASLFDGLWVRLDEFAQASGGAFHEEISGGIIAIYK